MAFICVDTLMASCCYGDLEGVQIWSNMGRRGCEARPHT